MTVPRLCFFCGSFLLSMFRVCRAFLSVQCSLVVTCWERADILALLCAEFCCVLSLSHVVSWVGSGTWLYRFLIFASPPLLFCTLQRSRTESWQNREFILFVLEQNLDSTFISQSDKNGTEHLNLPLTSSNLSRPTETVHYPQSGSSCFRNMLRFLL